MQFTPLLSRHHLSGACSAAMTCDSVRFIQRRPIIIHRADIEICKHSIIKLGIEPKKPTCAQIYFARRALPSANGGRVGTTGIEPVTSQILSSCATTNELSSHKAISVTRLLP